MTDQQLAKAQELKRTIAVLESELEKFKSDNPNGINVFLPNTGTLIDDVRKVFAAHREMYNKQFKEL